MNSELQTQVSPQKLLSAGLIIAGGLQVLLGIGCLVTPAIASIATEVLIGAILLMTGLADLTFAWELRPLQGNPWRFLRAGCFLLAGITLLAWPMSGIVTLAFVLGLMSLLDGGFRFATALSMRQRKGFAILDGGLGMLLGIIILSGWPSDSVLILGIIVGIRLMIGGFLAMMIGAGIRAMKIHT